MGLLPVCAPVGIPTFLCAPCTSVTCVFDLFGNRRSCVGRNPEEQVEPLNSRFRRNDDFGVFGQVYSVEIAHS